LGYGTTGRLNLRLTAKMACGILLAMDGDSTKSHRGEQVELWSPDSDGLVGGLLPPILLEKAARSGKGSVYELAGPVRRMLRNPPRVFRGITRDTDDDRGQTEGWLCFTGMCEERYHPRSGEATSSKGRVLMVYVNRDRAVYHWRWEASDQSQPNVPADMQNEDGTPRFKESLR
jgi:hypothetical protein